MPDLSFINSSFFQWVVMPGLIFLARVCDMSLDTIRILLMSRGKTFVAPLLGFFQVLIWLLVIRQIFINLNNVACYLAYAGGFAVGTFAGMYIEERIAVGVEVVRVITRSDATQLIEYLRQKDFGVTSMNAQGTTGQVNVIFTIVRRADVPKVLEAVKRFNPKAFYTVEAIRSISEGVFPTRMQQNISRKFTDK